MWHRLKPIKLLGNGGQTLFPVCAALEVKFLAFQTWLCSSLRMYRKTAFVCSYVLEQISECFLYSWKDLLNAHAVLLVMTPFTGLDAIPTFFTVLRGWKKVVLASVTKPVSKHWQYWYLQTLQINWHNLGVHVMCKFDNFMHWIQV